MMKYDRLTHALVAGLLTLMAAMAGRAYAVDGVIEINQARAAKGGITTGDTPGFPITIATGTFANEPMSFKLTGPLFISTTDDVIQIQSPHVTIDLNGFSISCLLPSCGGIGISATVAVGNVSVFNGTVRGFAEGVSLLGAASRIENVRATANVVGLRVGSSGTVRNCAAHLNTSDGIVAAASGLVSGNTATSNGGDGIQAGAGSNVIGNTATENTAVGLNLTTGIGYSQNVIRNNTGGTVDSGVSAGGNVCNGSTTCP
jgi:hypothetical protein